MKNKFFKSLALALSFATVISSVPVNAYELDSQGMSIENVEYQNTEDEDFTNSSDVFAQVGSTYQVTIPKVIVLSGESKSAEYKVSAEGDIAGYETIFVRPDRIVNLYSVNKDMQVGTIAQDKTGWTNNTIDVIGNGLIEANDITAGKWCGTFNFNIELNRVLGDVIEPNHVHNPGETKIENRIESTCTLNGSCDSVIYCTDCYAELSREFQTIPANGHTSGSVVEENRVEPTCVLNGSIDKVTYCTVCGEELSRTQEKIPFLGHNFVDYVCTRCGVDEHIHKCTTPVEENKILATLETPGHVEKVEYCDVCGLEMSRKYQILYYEEILWDKTNADNYLSLWTSSPATSRATAGYSSLPNVSVATKDAITINNDRLKITGTCGLYGPMQGYSTCTITLLDADGKSLEKLYSKGYCNDPYKTFDINIDKDISKYKGQDIKIMIALHAESGYYYELGIASVSLSLVKLYNQ